MSRKANGEEYHFNLVCAKMPKTNKKYAEKIQHCFFLFFFMNILASFILFATLNCPDERILFHPLS